MFGQPTSILLKSKRKRRELSADRINRRIKGGKEDGLIKMYLHISDSQLGVR